MQLDSGMVGWAIAICYIVANAGQLSGSSGIKESMEDIFTAVVGNLR